MNTVCKHDIRSIAILGSTGSIGTQTVDIVSAHPELYRAAVLSANTRWEQLAEQSLRLHPSAAVIADRRYEASLRQALAGTGIKVYGGREWLPELVSAPDIDIVVAAMVGYSGLDSTIAAASAGKRIALANKETLVAAGNIVTEQCRIHGAQLIPVDSEHSAIFQCLQGECCGNKAADGIIDRIILTASGGPFRNYDSNKLKTVTVEDALKHPNWHMGAKVTVDSASMMNKGFEMIEARWLFDCPSAKIEIAVHPQSIVHSMVAFADGSVKAQLGVPDMHLPIAYALGYPRRLPGASAPLRLEMMRELTFKAPDINLFPMLGYAYEAIERGGTLPAIMAAADEVAVEAFLNRRIGFTDMARLVRQTMDRSDADVTASLEAIIDADAQGRRLATEILDKLT